MNSYRTDTWAWEAQVNALKSELEAQAAEIERLRAALKNIRELNFTSDGWAHSDMIEQEIVFALAQGGKDE